MPTPVLATCPPPTTAASCSATCRSLAFMWCPAANATSRSLIRATWPSPRPCCGNLPRATRDEAAGAGEETEPPGEVHGDEGARQPGQCRPGQGAGRGRGDRQDPGQVERGHEE